MAAAIARPGLGLVVVSTTALLGLAEDGIVGLEEAAAAEREEGEEARGDQDLLDPEELNGEAPEPPAPPAKPEPPAKKERKQAPAAE